MNPFFALRTTQAKPDHIPVFTYFSFGKSAAKNKDINSQEEKCQANHYGYDQD